jgi:predicted nucleotidyltransferase
MKDPGTSAASSLVQAVTERALSSSDDPALDSAVLRLVSASGDALVGLVFFGSRRTGAARADARSAYDLFVVVEAYRPFYDALRRAGLTRKRPALVSLVSRWLPPTQYSLRFGSEGVHVKAAVVRRDTFRRETSPRRRDHFCIGRLCQPTRILHSRDEDARRHLLEGLVSAHRETWTWARPWLPGSFDADDYGRSALGTSMRWEVRPEPSGRAGALWEAQRALQAPVFAALLVELEGRGELVADGPVRVRPARPVGALERLRLEVYFRRSILRATARWLKHTVTFEGWLDYIAAKASRHTGEDVVLTDRERRWPFVFLWGRLFRYLRTKNRKGSPS